MNNQINQCQQRLYYKLFATLPSSRNVNNIFKVSNLDLEVKDIYFFRNKYFWFTRCETEDKFLFLFGFKDKAIKNITENDVCLIIDFDKNIQLNDNCLGLFRLKTSEIRILINWRVLKKRYPNIDIGNFKIKNIESFDDYLTLDVIDLGELDGDFIENLEKLIKVTYSENIQRNSSKNINKYSDDCKICSKKKANFKIDSNLVNLSNLKPELCGRCIEKIVVSEFYTKITPLLNGNRTEELNVAKEKFGNDYLFDIGLKLLEKYGIIQYIGVKKLFYTIDTNSYLVKKYIKYSDKNNLLINHINDNVITSKNQPLEEKTTEEQMEIVIDALINGKSRIEAAKLANIPPYKIVHWYNEGRQGNKSENVYFFNKLREIENNNKKQKEELRDKMKKTLNELKEGKDISQIDFITHEELNEWISEGKKNTPPYNNFYKEYKILIKNEIKEYEIKEINRKIFFENLKSGKTKEESAKNGDVELSLINKWYLKGSKDIKPFVEFYNKYLEAEKNEKLYVPKVVKFDSFGNKNILAKMNGILEDLAYGKSVDEAIFNANVSKENYEYWIIRGKQNFGGIYVQFYNYVNELKSKQLEISSGDELENETLVDEGIYEPLLEEYEDLFDSMNQSGIAWVNKKGSKWNYLREINGKTISLSADTLLELYQQVINNDLIWGIRDYDKAKKILDIPEDFEIPNMEIEDEVENIDLGMYAPLPDEYEKSFNSINQSGIAWVNQVGNKLYYMKTVDGKNIRLSGENIYELYEKVMKANHIWGIRDYKRARKFIDFPEDFVIPSKPKDNELEEDVNFELDPDIYAPLPIEYERSFTSMNQSGIAWVNQVGNKLYYSKSVNGKSIRLSGENIYELYENVKKANHVWGIRDYSKAKQYIDIPEDFEIPEIQDNEENEDVLADEINEDIYAPLSYEHLSKFNPNPNNKTGIAWVNKVGNTWFYQRQQNGKVVKFSDSNIFKLHEKVIKNNQIWGIFDINKASKVIETNSIDDSQDYKPPKSTKPRITSDVTVNYIEKPKGQFEILIKGIIKNKDLIIVLSRLDLFKEDIKRIITTAINNESDIFIELEINKYSLHSFEEKIEDFGWEIIR